MDGERVVCVNGFLKTDTTPQRKLDEAAAARQRYFEDKRKNNLKILNL
jgi:hypothetical protein